MSDGSARFTPREVADLMGVASAALRAELTTLPGPVLSWHPAPGEWCAKEVVGHLIEAERRGFAGRIRFILDHDEPGLTAWDPAAVTRERRDCGRDMTDLLRELTELRDASVALVTDLRESDLERGGHHPEVGHVRVADLLHEWIHHDRNHIRQILANVQAFVWPAMGNTQRFSQP